MRTTHVIFVLPTVILLWACPACRFCCKGPAGSVQPDSGPGGADYKHNALTVTACGCAGTQYWIFEPDEPRPQSAPLVVFLHGWSATNPVAYGAWIKHIVRRGNIVVYPRYQCTVFTPGERFTPNAVMALTEALQRLRSPNHVSPQLDKVAFVGHSAGGTIAANLASAAPSIGLPQPKAVMCVQPIDRRQGNDVGIPFEDMSLIPPDTLLLAIAGKNDEVLGTLGARQIYTETVQIPPENKDYILFLSDDHGCPHLVADHYSPAAIDDDLDSDELMFINLAVPYWKIADTVNALDYFGFWKLFDALTDAAFYGTNREYALGNTPRQRYLGTWADGTPVKELIINQKCGLNDMIILADPSAGTIINERASTETDAVP